MSLAASALFLSGCATNTESRVTNLNAPGPAVGTASATKSTFTNERRMVRVWRTETTADGRTIQVPVEIEVDAYGRPIEQK